MREALRTECPTPEVLAQLFDGRVTGERSAELKAHLNGCALCAAEWTMMSEFAAGEPEPSEMADVDSIVSHVRRSPSMPSEAAPAWKRWFTLPNLPKLAGAFAVLALVVAAGLQLRSSRTTGLDGFEASDRMRSSTTIQNVIPHGDLDAIPGEFTWKPVSGAALYELRLAEVDGTELATVRSPEPHLIATDAMRAAMLPRKTLVVKVRALDAAGKPVAESDPVRFRFAPQDQK